MTAILYPARIHKRGKIFYVQFLDMKNGFTYGESLEEAKQMAADVLSGLLISYIEHEEPIPKPSGRKKGKDIYLVAPDAKLQAAILLRLARASRSQGDVARTMGTTWQAYQKIEQPNNNTTLSKLQKAAKALGKNLVIELVG